jgi:hypothetical protein
MMDIGGYDESKISEQIGGDGVVWGDEINDGTMW